MKENFRRQKPQEVPEENENQLEGRNALQEALRAGRTIDKVFIADGDTDKSLQRLAALAKEAGAVIVPVDRRKLDMMSTTSPVFSFSVMRTALPLMRPPIHLIPRFEWMSKAKSSTVAPA